QPAAEKRVKTSLILEKIAQEKSLNVTDDELKERMLQTAMETGQPPDKIIEFYSQNNMLGSLRQQMLTEKTLKFLLENANIKDTPAPSESVTEGENSESGDESEG
ncbi:MAG: hypothetical protein JRI34_07180, partial [Deltaproteobacteria bacterium]|nr:hypothetical protein [Deltaproteobacteria bacterium]